MANALAALEMGCSEFDASLGGLGGSPFAPGAGGNLATEDLAHMLLDMGIDTGLDRGGVERLREIGAWLRDELGHPLGSRVLEAGTRRDVPDRSTLGE